MTLFNLLDLYGLEPSGFKRQFNENGYIVIEKANNPTLLERIYALFSGTRRR